MKRIHWKVNGEGFVSPALSDEEAEVLKASLEADSTVYGVREETIEEPTK